MFNCTLIPRLLPVVPDDNPFQSTAADTSTPVKALRSWAWSYLVHEVHLTDRHDRAVESVHPNQATAWQQAVTEAAEQFSLTKLFCTQDTALQTPIKSAEFGIIQTIHMAKEDWSKRLRFKTSRLFFNGITARLNACFIFLLQQAAKLNEQERAVSSEEVLRELQQMGTSCALLGNAKALCTAGVGSDLPIKRDPKDHHWYNFGTVDAKGISCSVICLGKDDQHGAEHDSLTAGGDPDNTLFILPTAVGHFSTTGVVYASSVLNPNPPNAYGEDGIAWHLCGKETIDNDGLWLTATQRFRVEVDSAKIKALTIAA
jgi:hypothetical protein